MNVHHRWVQATFLVLCAFFFAVLVGFFLAWRASSNRKALRVPAAHFLFQVTSASIWAYRTDLFMFSLGMHWAEYHVIMFPRMFRRPQGATKVSEALGGNKAFFYVLVLILGAWQCFGPTLGRAHALMQHPSLQIVAGMFMSINMVHFFIDGFVWKFSNPFFQQQLGPLYFPKPVAATAVPASPSYVSAPLSRITADRVSG
jgi:hypothetical protein